MAKYIPKKPKCPHCGQKCEGAIGLSTHIRRTHPTKYISKKDRDKMAPMQDKPDGHAKRRRGKGKKKAPSVKNTDLMCRAVLHCEINLTKGIELGVVKVLMEDDDS